MFNRNSWAKYLVFTIETDSSLSVGSNFLGEAAGRPILWCKYENILLWSTLMIRRITMSVVLLMLVSSQVYCFCLPNTALLCSPLVWHRNMCWWPVVATASRWSWSHIRPPPQSQGRNMWAVRETNNSIQLYVTIIQQQSQPGGYF